jgi:predicted RNA-binding protein with PUA-like domain
MSTKSYWLLKSEPTTYPIDQLKQDKRTAWTGVRNYQARNFMQEMRAGDECLFYHSGDEKAVVGVAKVVSAPYADPTQFDAKSHYFDPKATKNKPRWMIVDVAFAKKFKHPVTLAEVKPDPVLKNMMLARATRLSVQPVDKKQFEYLLRLAV